MVCRIPPNAGKIPTVFGTNEAPRGAGVTPQFYEGVNFIPCLMLPKGGVGPGHADRHLRRRAGLPLRHGGHRKRLDFVFDRRNFL